MDDPKSVSIPLDLGNGMALELVMAEGDAPQGGRQCGSCGLCCKLVPVASLNKKAGEKCMFARAHPKGHCTVHDKPAQPVACKLWSCRWLIDATIKGRPDRSHLVFDVMPDFIFLRGEDGIEHRMPVVQIWGDPAYPNAWREPHVRAWIDANTAATGMLALVRFGGEGDQAIVIAPPSYTHAGWIEKRQVLSRRRED